MKENRFTGRVLIVSNECFSDNTSNGRTLENMLGVVECEHLAQFYIHGTPDFSFCHRYFRVTDCDVLNAVISLGHRKPVGTVEPAKNTAQHIKTEAQQSKKIINNCCTRFLRNLVWQSRFWWGENLDTFLDDFRPEIVLLQAGDMPVMFNIAVRIAKRCNAKLIMYNSEGYVLKEVLYNSSRKNDVWHIVLKSSLKRAYSSFMKNADYCIYSTEYIEAAYQKIYPHTGKSTVLYTVSEMEALPDESGHSQFELLYCGNLGVGRASVINRIAKILFEVDERAILSVYGRFVSEEDEKLVTSNHNVRFGGFVPYSKIPDLMSHASMLLHCENSERVDNLKYAFSTKIADCLASGRPFLVFADSGYPFVEYLKNNHCCHVSNTEDELRQTIKGCIGNVEFRNRFHSDAIRVAKENHSKSANDEKMYLILTSLIN